MTTNTTPTDLKTLPEVHRIDPPGHHGTPQKPSKGKKRAFVWVVFLVIIASVAGYAVWRAGQPGLIPVQNPGGRGGFGGGRGGGGGPLPVVVAKATKAAVPVYLSGLGNVTAYYTVTVQSRVVGQLMSVNFKEGDLVQQGQVLAEIDPRPYQVQLELAEGTLAKDQALLENAKLDLERYKTLLAQDAVPKQQLDTQTALVAQYEGNIKTDTANIDNAKLQLTYAKVTAPITGVVGLRLVDPGNIIQTTASGGIIVITQLQPISVLFTIPEDTLPQVMSKLRAGEKLSVDAYNRDSSQKLASGQLLTVDNQIDATTGTSKLKAIFENKDNKLFPQQFVNIKLHVDTLQDQIVIPTVAVQQGQQGTFVYKIDDNARAHLQVVKVGVGDQTQTAILSGLDAGDQVAVDGADRLQDGSQVRVRRSGELEAEAAADAAALAARGRGRGQGKKGAFKKGDGNGGGFKKGDGNGGFKKGGGAPQ